MLDVTPASKAHNVRWSLIVFLLLARLAQAQTTCTALQPNNPKDLSEQIKAFLSDDRVAIAGTAIALMGTLRKSVSIQAIGGVTALASQISIYLKKNPDSQVCVAPKSLAPPLGYNSMLLIGPDMDHLIRNTDSKPALSTALKPFQSTGAQIPTFPLTTSLPKLSNLVQGSVRVSSPVFPVLAVVSGKVLDERGNPISGAIVSLASSQINKMQPQWRTTLSDGSYSFVDSVGDYFISARLTSPVSGGDLSSGSLKVSLTSASSPAVNLYVHPQRAAAAPDISPEEKRKVINFIAAADRAESAALQTGDTHPLAQFYTGAELTRVQQNCLTGWNRSVVSYLEQGHVTSVRYFAGKATIEVDTVETWSHADRKTGQPLSDASVRAVPQTISIQMTPGGWYIDKITFAKSRN